MSGSFWRRVILLACLGILSTSTVTVPSDRVNFQGRLTGSDGLPVANGVYTLYFTIYGDSVGGTSLWTETHVAQVINGQFDVSLGRTNALDPSDLGPEDRYLEVQVQGGAGVETLLPRSRLGSVPRAGLAARMSGDIHTAERTLSIRNLAGDSGITLGVFPNMVGGPESGFLTFYRLAGGANRSLELGDYPEGAMIELFDAHTDLPEGPTMRIGSSAPEGAWIKMFDPQPEPPKLLVDLGGDPEQGGYLNLAGSNGAWIRMFDPQPEPPKLLVELGGDPVQGPHMSFADQIGQVMGVEPSPFNGGFKMSMFDPSSGSPEVIGEIASSYQAGATKGVARDGASAVGGSFSIRAFDPQPEPPHALVDLYAQYGLSNSSRFALAGSQFGATSVTKSLVTAGASLGGGTLRVGPAADTANAGAVISLRSSSSESRLQVEGTPTIAPAPPIALVGTSSAARVGIGTASPTEALQVVGNICYTGTIGACSDEKYKRDVETIDHALDAVSRLRGVRYSWRVDEYPEMHFSTEPQVGFIAQEVEAVTPEAVSVMEDGSYVVDYSRMTPLLLEAVKELRVVVERQQAEIERLQKQIETGPH